MTVEHEGEVFEPEAAPATPIERSSSTVSSLYDLSTSGPGTFTFDPVSRFQVIGLDGSVKTTSDTAGTNVVNGHSTSISIPITDFSKRGLDLSKLTISCDLDTRISDIESGVKEAETLASTAVSYIKSKGAGDRLYKTYFGKNRISAVVEGFNNVLGADLYKLTIHCIDTTKTCGTTDYDAIMKGPSNSKIYYCNSFFGHFPLISLCRNETSVRARELFGGTTLRLFAYSFIWGVDDGRHSCEDSQGLSDQEKIKNGDNYEVSTQTPRRPPRARMLTWGRGICSASLPRSTRTPSAKRVTKISEGEGYQMLCA